MSETTSSTSIIEKGSRDTGFNALEDIKHICDSIVNSSLKPERTPAYKKALGHLNDYFGTTESQTWILCFAVFQHFEGNWNPQVYEFSSFLDINVLEAAAMNSDFIELRKKGLIEYIESRSSFKITEDVIKSVLKNEAVSSIPYSDVNYTDFIRKFAKVYEDDNYSDKCAELLSALKNLEDLFEEHPLVIRCKHQISDDNDRFMFYDMCLDNLNGFPSRLLYVISRIYESYDCMRIAHLFMEEKQFLMKAGLVEFDKKEDLTHASIALTEKGKKLLHGSDYSLFENKIDDSSLQKPSEIRTKKLFYSEENQKQMDDITKALSNTKYAKITQRLAEKGMPSGITVLLHGAPGTGKTESVLQIAKKTGRAIMKVDISSTKSAWFGESEKLIKKVFTDYKAVCRDMSKIKGGRIPILLFNECDGVLSKRKDVGDSNTAQVENAMQNIILEEMENFEGILMATTNLVDNLDPAFERRFLFKVCFEKPSLDAKKAIWKNKMPWIAAGEAEELARDYNFSGGEIDNIVRKAEMKEIISGNRPGFVDIVDLCRVEKLKASISPRRMGFAV